jgi:2-succinyl-6-hydroxy-2,4-cyclohexadiene-1-carboxylate synthase
MLATSTIGPATGAPRLVLVHGFTQNARCWGEFGDACSRTFDVLAVDAPGHGQSGHDRADLVEAGRLLIEAGGAGHYLGYSMGGRMLLHAALNDRFGLIRSLILVGVTGGIDDPVARMTRRRDDDHLANEIESMGTQAFVDEWLSKPMFAGLTDETSSRTKRFENSAEGLAMSLRHCGTGMQEPLWDRLSALRIPVLIMAGTRDEKFTALGGRLLDAIGSNARFVAIEGGHAVHLENPQVTAAVVASWGTQLG